MISSLFFDWCYVSVCLWDEAQTTQNIWLKPKLYWTYRIQEARVTATKANCRVT